MGLAAAAITASVIQGVVSTNASNKAAKVAGEAADKNAAVQREMYQQTRQDLAPYANNGVTAGNALMQRFGLAPGGSVPAGGGTAQAPAPSYGGSTYDPTMDNRGGQHPAPTGFQPGASDPTGGGVYGGPRRPTRIPQPGDPDYEMYKAEIERTGGVLGQPVGGQGQPMGAAGPGGAPPAPQAPAAAYQPTGPLTDEQAQQLFKDRPDVLASYQQGHATADPNSPHTAQVGLADNPNDYARYWYSQMGGNKEYNVPAPQQNQAPPQPGAQDSSPVPGQTFTSSNNGGLGPRTEAIRPDDPRRKAMNRQDFAAAPTFNTPNFGPAPTTSQYVDPSQFTTSPGYQFRLDQGTRASQAAFGAKGLLQSDAAIKALNDYSQGMASSEYGNWFSQGMQRFGADAGQFNTDRATGLSQFNTDRNVGMAQYNADRNRFDTNHNFDTIRADNNYNFDVNRADNNYVYDTNRADNIFDSDRGYNTAQYNTYNDNLFRLYGTGANAAAGQGSAAQTYASNATSNNNNLASAQGNAALAGAAGVNNALSSGVRAYTANYANPFSSGGAQYTGVPGGMNGAIGADGGFIPF